MDADEPARQPGGGDANTIVLVALYLLLLAVFILLNSISQKEQNRVEGVIQSLQDTFQRPISATPPIDKLQNRPGWIANGAGRVGRVASLFEALVPEATFHRGGRGHLIRVSLPAERLFDPESASLRFTSAALLDRISEILRPDGGATEGFVTIEMGVGDTLPSGPEAVTELAVVRAGAFARALRTRGAGADMMTIGLSKGDGRLVHLSFGERRRSAAPATARPLDMRAPRDLRGG